MAPRSDAPLGAMRHRVALQAPVATPDGAGGATVTWSTVASLWGRLEWLSGDERMQADRPEQASRHRIVTRWRSGVDAGRRLTLGERVFDIRVATDPDGGRRRLVCMVEEVTP